MPKGMPGSYDSSRPHTSDSHPEPHVDIHYRGEKGEVVQKEHVSLSEWIWNKISGGESEGGNKEKPTLRG